MRKYHTLLFNIKVISSAEEGRGYIDALCYSVLFDLIRALIESTLLG